ncbi:MAG: 16S rRNA (guanine(966)-N(2))-methyltransferase RsmD [Nitrospirae bacterium]|nr:16S rRNA (guanine(966)-N(2))-methyltransferase RsmD [Nitrospirota bacterium]
MLRIVGGEAKGRKLNIVKGKSVRPTADRVKESLFNILREEIRDNEVLDLFAGVGSLGIEALSRGAKRAVFVDKGSACARVIGKNLDILGFRERAEIYHEEVAKAVRWLAQQERKFGLVFVDPPYGSDLAEKTLEGLAGSQIVDEEGTVIVEHYWKRILPEAVGTLGLVRNEKYGDTSLSFYKYCSNKSMEP